LRCINVGLIDLQNDYQKRMTEATQTDDGVTSVTQEVDGSEKIQIWKDVSGGKSRGRCYGVGHLAPNLRYGVTHLTDEADAHHIRVENQKIEAARAEAARARANAELLKLMQRLLELMLLRQMQITNHWKRRLKNSKDA
jgi:hypothetical protein